jgi:hypothetical protein
MAKTAVETVTNKLSAGYHKRLDEAEVKVRQAMEELTEAVEGWNEMVRTKWETDVNSFLADYQGAVSEANELRDQIHSEMVEYFDNKSEGWQQGDRGDAYQTWMDEWDHEFATFEIEAPEEIDTPEDDVADLMEQLPREVS